MIFLVACGGTRGDRPGDPWQATGASSASGASGGEDSGGDDDGSGEGDGGGDTAADDGGDDGQLPPDVPAEPPGSPYTGGWDIGDCQGDIVPTGNQPGGIAHDFTRMNQHGEALRLYDFCHTAVLLTAGAFW